MHTAPCIPLSTAPPATRQLLRACRCLAMGLAAAALNLAGCGGGGGGGSNPASTGGDASSPTITIVAAPASQSVGDGRSAVLHVLALSSTPLTQQWLRNGVAVAGATDSDYVTPLLSMADDGVQYAAVLRDANGSARTAAATISIQPLAPGIAQQPQARTVAPGESAGFTVLATGTPPLNYQWQRDGVDIVGANAADFNTAATTAADNGAHYRALVRNAAGTVISDAALLALSNASPVLLQLVQVAVVAPGQRLVLTTRLAGSPPFDYQWLRNGQPLPGAAGSSDNPVVSLTTDALTAADGGARYALAVNTANGSTRSTDALLSVIETPRVAAGGSHSLARSADGLRVWAWGDNGHGQLGLGSTGGSRNVPTALGGLPVLSAIAAGADHSLGLADDGSVWAWGGNATGALGDGTRSDSPLPRRVGGLMRPAIAIAAGTGRSFALLADGSLWAWGENAGGALGLGHQNDALAPTAVGSDLAGFGSLVAVAAGARHTLALRADGRVFAFGSMPVAAPGGPTLQTLPALVEGITSIAGIAAGDGFSVALDIGGRLWSWGLNGGGQLGLGSTAALATPSRLTTGQTGAPLPPALALAAGGGVVLAQPPAGPPLAWGTGAAGQLGLGGAIGTLLAPSAVTALTVPLRGISVGGGHVLGMLADGSVVAWGANGAGQLGIGSSEAQRTEPVQLPKLRLD